MLFGLEYLRFGNVSKHYKMNSKRTFDPFSKI